MRVVLITVIGLMVASCATIIRGSDQEVKFDSQPQGAEMQMGDYHCASVPCSISVPREISAVATFKLEGCEDKDVLVHGRISDNSFMYAAGSLIFGAVGGLLVDLATGALNDVNPDPVLARMEC